MKKAFLMLAAAFGLMSSLQAQTTFGIGARLGVGLGSASAKNTTDVSTLTTFTNVAVIAEVGISKLFAIQPEIQALSKGFSTKSGVDTYFNYVGLNVLPKLRFGNETIEGFVMAGPSANLKYSAKSVANGLSGDFPGVSSFDFSAIFGLGAAYKFTGNDKLFIDVRNNVGLLNTNASTNVDNFKLHQLAFNLGYIRTFGGSK